MITPVVVKDILSQEQIDRIYNQVKPFIEDNPHRVLTDSDLGYFAYTYPLDRDIRNTIRDKAIEISGVELNKVGISFARYTSKTGYIPQLPPHYDIMLTKPSFTFSVQLNNTKPWNLSVEDNTYSLSYNEALFFSGTHQVHYRPPIFFDTDDYFDILVCQISSDKSDILTDEHRAYMQERIEYYKNML